MSVFDNVAYGLKLHYSMKKAKWPTGGGSLSRAALWTKERFPAPPGHGLSGGSSSVMHCPGPGSGTEVLLMDEPTSAIDPIATAKIEELINSLKSQLFHRHCHPQHAAGRPGLRFHRLLLSGHIIEFGENPAIFTNPSKKKTEEYITGRFGDDPLGLAAVSENYVTPHKFFSPA